MILDETADAGQTPNRIDDCWNRIGVQGDRSCVELTRHIHCRNCPVHSSAALKLLDRQALAEDAVSAPPALPAGDVADDSAVHSVVIFRIGSEWLALPASTVSEVTERRPVHSVPHRRNGTVLGITNGRGELLPCVSLARMLGIDEAGVTSTSLSSRLTTARLLVIRRGTVRAACPVDEIHGVHRFRASDHKALPATVSRAVSHSSAIAVWRDRTVGLLDSDALFGALQRSLA